MKSLSALIINDAGIVEAAIKFNGEDFTYDGGRYNGPKSAEINRIRGIARVFNKPFVLYKKNLPQPWNISEAKRELDSYSSEDVETVKGKYLSNVIRDAINDEEKTMLLLWITIGVAVLGIVIGGINTFFLYKIAKFIHII